MTDRIHASLYLARDGHVVHCKRMLQFHDRQFVQRHSGSFFYDLNVRFVPVNKLTLKSSINPNSFVIRLY